MMIEPICIYIYIIYVYEYRYIYIYELTPPYIKMKRAEVFIHAALAQHCNG